MPDSIIQLAERMFVGPVWPASILVCLLVVYTIFALIGLIDFGFDVPDLELDPSLDLDVDLAVDVPTVDVPDGVHVDVDFLHGLGAASIRATNFGRVPVVLWGGVFAVAFWGVSYGLWHGFDINRHAPPEWVSSTLLSIRNFVIAMIITKMVTQPMLGYFVAPPSYDHKKLVGATCEICTTEATHEFGQAKFRTNASPLLLNVRTDGPHIPKGTEVRIIGFDRDKRIYKVAQLQPETHS
ncbi:MAG: NfeD family protein [Rubripirellula sp.]